MTRLNATAKAALREAGITQAAWARVNYMSSGKWSGDECGCPDDRCANGFHHLGADDCGCLPTLIGQYFEWLRGTSWHSFDMSAPEYVNRVVIDPAPAATAPEPAPDEREAYAAILRDHPGKVVAVKGTQVIATSDDTESLLAHLRENDLRADVVFRVPGDPGNQAERED